MLLRLALIVASLSFIGGCVNGMKMQVAPPQCTVDEKSSECSTQQQEPDSMMEEEFFQDEVNASGFYDWRA